MSKTRWICAYCSKEIARDELYTFISAGSVHFACLENAARVGSGDSEPLIHLLKAELNLLVAYKARIGSISDDEARKLLEANMRDSERHAALLSKLISKALRE